MKTRNRLIGLIFAALLVPFFNSCQREDRNLGSESTKPKQDLESDQLEGFNDYGTPIELSATTALGEPTTVVLTD